ncbi:DsbA family oxidoreductase [Luteococcus peritonei]|uniref:DsbA family oxidoreductase n=1 Tax=Luteococcus peritonei TaxID=88874 RepID=A0ABW4RRE2_9ACTN
MTLQIDIWSDIACPWCLIGKRRFDAAVAQLPFADQLEVDYHSFLLDPELPTRYEGSEAQYLAERKQMPVEQVAQMLAQVTEVAAGEGLAYDFESLVVASSRRAHRLLQAARRTTEQNRADGLVGRLNERLMRAHFEQGMDIGDDEVLVEAAVACGMEEQLALRAIDDASLDEAVQLSVATAGSLGISGVPFYVVDQRYGISGAQPTEAFVQALQQVWSEKQANEQPVLAPLATEGEACGPEGCA